MLFLCKEEKRASKIFFPPNKMLVSFSIARFWLTMMSQIESIDRPNIVYCTKIRNLSTNQVNGDYFIAGNGRAAIQKTGLIFRGFWPKWRLIWSISGLHDCHSKTMHSKIRFGMSPDFDHKVFGFKLGRITRPQLDIFFSYNISDYSYLPTIGSK